jgi:hypothetical protein
VKIRSDLADDPPRKARKRRASMKNFDLFCRVVFFANSTILAALVYLSYEHRWVVIEAANKLDAAFGLYDAKHIGKLAKQRFLGIFSDPEVLRIDLKHINVQQLEYQRSAALKGVKEFSYVPAALTYNNLKFKTKLRLKGDRKIHFDHLDTASFRIKIKGDQTLWGMKFFSLHKPRARNYIHEWIFLHMMKREGLVTPRYKFVSLVVNGKDNGIYAVEEHYTKLLLERNRSREGPILRFDESTGTKYNTSTVTPYEQNKWLSEEKLPVTQKAIQLLEGYRRGELPFGDVFDVKKWAVFFAVADLTSTQHALISKSLRLYYNPITSRLEPIPFDGHYGTTARKYPLIAAELGITKENNWTYETDRDWFYGLFNDPVASDPLFIEEYVSALGRLSEHDYLESFFSAARSALNRNLAIINSESNFHDNIFSFGPLPFVYKENEYYEIAKYIRGLLVPEVDAFVVARSPNEITLEVTNKHRALPIQILGAGCSGVNFRPTKTHFLRSRISSTEVTSAEIVTLMNSNSNSSTESEQCLSLYVKMPGIDTTHTIVVRPWRQTNSESLSQDTMRKTKPYLSPEIFRIGGGNELVVSPGRHIFQESVVLDGIASLQIDAGTTLVLKNNASLIVKAPVLIRGSAREPVNIIGENGGGIAVIDAGGLSVMEHVVFDRLSNPKEEGWSLSGAVTFYESPVNADHVTFSNNDSEDAFNGVRSDIRITNSRFSDVKRDAIDIDHGNLIARNLFFTDVGNDAIDVSGTKATIDSISIKNVGDKALSIGEKSSLNARNIRISGANIGVASKDGSFAELDKLSIEAAEIGYAVFQKKSEHGPGRIESRDAEHANVNRISIVEMGSTLVVNTIPQTDKVVDVRELLYEE